MNKKEIAELERWISEAIEPNGGTWTCSYLTDGKAWVFNPFTGEGKPRPWATDEAANAMLLEMMLESNSEITFSHWSDSSYLTVKKQTPFSVHVDICREKKRVEFRTDAQDRKLAVCLAFKAYKEQEKP